MNIYVTFLLAIHVMLEAGADARAELSPITTLIHIWVICKSPAASLQLLWSPQKQSQLILQTCLMGFHAIRNQGKVM